MQPPSPYQPPLPLLPHQRIGPWFRSRRRRLTKIGLGWGALVVGASLCTCAQAVYGSTLPPAPTATSGPQVTRTNSTNNSTDLTSHSRANTSTYTDINTDTSTYTDINTDVNTNADTKAVYTDTNAHGYSKCDASRKFTTNLLGCCDFRNDIWSKLQ